jgi:hypothetical protein
VKKLVIGTRALEIFIICVRGRRGVDADKVSDSGVLSYGFSQDFLELLAASVIEALSDGMAVRVRVDKRLNILQRLWRRLDSIIGNPSLS